MVGNTVPESAHVANNLLVNIFLTSDGPLFDLRDRSYPSILFGQFSFIPKLMIVFVQKRVIPNLIHTDSLLGTRVEDLSQEIFGGKAQFRRHVIFGQGNRMIHASNVILRCVIEWRCTSEHNVENDTTAPDICFGTVIRPASDDFGSGIVRATAGSGQLFAFGLKSSHSKVDKFDLSIVSIEKNVLWLEVAVVDVKSMTVEKRCHDLAEDVDSLLLVQTPTLFDIVEKLTTLYKLHYKVSRYGQLLPRSAATDTYSSL